MVAELAEREHHRPGSRTVRSRKLLADTDWNATYYRQRFQTPEEILNALRRVKIQYVALHSADEAPKPAPHALLLAEALGAAPNEWHPAGRFAGVPGERTVAFSRIR